MGPSTIMSSAKLPQERTKVVVRNLPPTLGVEAFKDVLDKHVSADSYTWLQYYPGKIRYDRWQAAAPDTYAVLSLVRHTGSWFWHEAVAATRDMLSPCAGMALGSMHVAAAAVGQSATMQHMLPKLTTVSMECPPAAVQPAPSLTCCLCGVSSPPLLTCAFACLTAFSCCALPA